MGFDTTLETVILRGLQLPMDVGRICHMHALLCAGAPRWLIEEPGVAEWGNGHPTLKKYMCYAPLGFQKSPKPCNTLYTLPSEPQPDRKRV